MIKIERTGNINIENDPDAIHKNSPDEINTLDIKATPISADMVIIEDSEDSWLKKKAAFPSTTEVTDPNAIHKNVADEIQAIPLKPFANHNDLVLIEDSDDLWAKKSTYLQDIDAIHQTEEGEIYSLLHKITPDSADVLVIEDSTDTWKKKYTTISSVSVDQVSIHKNASDEINSITEKILTSLGDKVIIEDSEDTWNKKSVQISNLIPPIYKSIFIPAQPDSALGNRRVQAVAGTGAYNFNFMFPLDFVEFGPSGGIFVVGFTQSGAPGTDRDIDLNVEYDNGPNTSRTYYTTGDATTLYDLTGTLNVQWLLPFHTLISDPGAGKTGGINVDHNAIGGTISYIGVLLIYR